MQLLLYKSKEKVCIKGIYIKHANASNATHFHAPFTHLANYRLMWWHQYLQTEW